MGMKKGQKHIYYISGETKDAVEKSPFLERLRKKDLEGLYYTDPIDEYAMPQLTEFKGFQFMGASKENLKLDDDDSEEKKLKKLQEMHKPLTDWFKETLGSKVEKAVISNRLLETPAIIVSSQYGWSTNMERIMKAQTMGNNDRASAMVSQKTLEINPATLSFASSSLASRTTTRMPRPPMSPRPSSMWLSWAPGSPPPTLQTSHPACRCSCASGSVFLRMPLSRSL